VGNRGWETAKRRDNFLDKERNVNFRSMNRGERGSKIREEGKEEESIQEAVFSKEAGKKKGPERIKGKRGRSPHKRRFTLGNNSRQPDVESRCGTRTKGGISELLRRFNRVEC